MIVFLKVLLSAIFIAGITSTTYSQETEDKKEETSVGEVTGLAIPRYVSMKASRGYARKGSHRNYAVNWEFTKAGIPFRVLDEDGSWRLIETQGGVGGWMYHALLSGKRTVLITNDNTPIMALPEENSKILALAEAKIIGTVLKCELHWCEIEVKTFNGWVHKNNLWGVDPDEVIE